MSDLSLSLYIYIYIFLLFCLYLLIWYIPYHKISLSVSFIIYLCVCKCVCVCVCVYEQAEREIGWMKEREREREREREIRKSRFVKNDDNLHISNTIDAITGESLVLLTYRVFQNRCKSLILVMIYYWDKKLHVSCCEFMLDLDSVWAQLKIFL